MFVSFFPKPKLFFTSAVLWSLAAVLFWYLGGQQLGAYFGLPPATPDTPVNVGITLFIAKPFLWFYIYYTIVVLAFYAFWAVYSPHPWQNWSILGSAIVIFATYFSVQVGVAFNTWYGPYYDLVQAALAKTRPVTARELYLGLVDISGLVFVAITIGAINKFFVSHYIFRWRTAMNSFFMQHWDRLRHIEGASQRVQDDTMRFSTTMESLGVSLVSSLMTLIAFLPILFVLSKDVTELPIIGDIPYALVIAAVGWALFGTIFLAVAGFKLPGLEFKNQRVEAAYRKELVYGEDHADRAQPPTVAELFSNVRKNYFRLYFHYLYFNVARIFYLQADNLVLTLILIPSLAAGKLTLGLMTQIQNVFQQVSSSFQYLVNSWTVIVELISIHKRLRAFEAVIYDEPLPAIDENFLQTQEES